MIIRLSTFIPASQQQVFDWSLDIDIHKMSVAHTGEEAIAGVMSGKIGLNETVTWRAKHFFRWRTMTVKIVSIAPYAHFRDEMIKGEFKTFKHDHYFEAVQEGTLMKDQLEFESPFGLFGRFIDLVLMRWYLKKLLISRNDFIKAYALSTRREKLSR